jgi:hypothetical protein
MSTGGYQRRSNTAPAAGSSSGSLSRLASLALPSPGGLHSRTGSVAAAEDASFAAAQELASVMNAPAAASSSWLAAWPFAQTEDFDAPPPPLPPGTLPEVRQGRQHPFNKPSLQPALPAAWGRFDLLQPVGLMYRRRPIAAACRCGWLTSVGTCGQ